MADLAWEVPRIFSGLLMLTLALWVLALDRRSRLLQVFALFMVVRGVMNILLPFGGDDPEGVPNDFLATTNVYYQIAVPFMAVIFAGYLLMPAERAKRWGLALAGGLLLLELWYFLDHEIYFGTPEAHPGWLHRVFKLSGLAYMVVGHALVRGTDVALPRYVAGVAYMLFPLFQAIFDWFLTAHDFMVGTKGPTWRPDVDWIFVNGLHIVVLLYGAFIIREQARLAPKERMRWMWWAVGVATVGSMIPIVLGELLDLPRFPLSLPINGLLTAAMPVAIGWALTQDAFYTKYHAIQMPMVGVSVLFLVLWGLIIGALYAAVEGARAVAAIIGAVALAVLLFLLLQSAAVDPRGEADKI